jgi:glycosyltransferase involved in cell wall biosynthesis
VSDATRSCTTVVIPVWDDYAGSDLDAAVTSLRSQDVPVHIVLVDNASNVPVTEVGGIEVVRSTTRLPLGAARNLGLERVGTPYVLVWDADDVMLPGTLAILQREIDSALGLAAFGMAIVEDSGQRHRWPRRWVSELTRWPAAFSLLNCMWSVLPTTGATIMRTALLRAGGGYSAADSGDDWVAGVSLSFRGRIGWSERPGRIYRIRDQSIWARHMDVHHQFRHASVVRGRIRSDTGIPRWARRVLPLIGLGQYSAIAGHVVVAAARRARRGRGAGRR